MTKVQLERENESLKARLEQLRRAMSAADRAILTVDGVTHVAKPLSPREAEFVRDDVSDAVCRQWDGSKGEFTDIVSWRVEELLPQYRAYSVLASYSQEDGVYVSKIWGLVPLQSQEVA